MRNCLIILFAAAYLSSCRFPLAIRPGSLITAKVLTVPVEQNEPLWDAADVTYQAYVVRYTATYTEEVGLQHFGFSLPDLMEDVLAYSYIEDVLFTVPFVVIALPFFAGAVGDAYSAPAHFVRWELPATILPGYAGVGYGGGRKHTLDLTEKQLDWTPTGKEWRAVTNPIDVYLAIPK
jgi:hypothetical protein